MLTGRAYLRIEKSAHGKVMVNTVRTRKPESPGVWIAVNLKVPESVFAPYETELELSEKDLDGVIILLPDELALMGS